MFVLLFVILIVKSANPLVNIAVKVDVYYLAKNLVKVFVSKLVKVVVRQLVKVVVKVLVLLTLAKLVKVFVKFTVKPPGLLTNINLIKTIEEKR